MKKENDQEIIRQFKKTLEKYRALVFENFNSRMGDEEDKRPLEKKLVEQFVACPQKGKNNLMFLTLKIIAKPYAMSENYNRLNVWFQDLAFKRLAEMEKTMKN